MRETPPAPDVLSSIFHAPSVTAQWVENMAETQQVRAEESSNDNSPKPRKSRSQRKFKASNMSFVEMVEMVDILKRADYDGKYGPYLNPNVRKAKIMTKVVKHLHRNFGVRRSKDQLRKRWSDLKLREHDQYRKIRKLLCKREKRLGTSEDTRDPPPPKEGEIPKPQAEDEVGDVYEVGEIVTTTGDVDVVEEKSNFTSESAQILIGEIMGCNRDLENIKENINDFQQKMKNIDVLGRI
ncbi:hypothetical protein AB205_0053930 [Aquarana catesbeiana]|uniref:Uncharacterized protein n=1 Tax=Aquarana catesbeiana TaxID=8400 RepID=A0A2G9SCD4_AQUCT|nr:hypothetical protein AB205_0053930 [Aquarana catesbeiana]